MRALRRAALVAVVSAQVGTWVAGVLPVPLLVAAVAVTVGAERLSARAPAGRAALLRHVATAGVLLLALTTVPRVVSGAELRGVLGPLLVGVVALQALSWHSRREVGTGVVGAVGLLVLGASFAPDVLVGLPLVVGWGAALTACVLAASDAVAPDADVVLPGASPRGPVVVATALAAALGLVAFLLVPVPEDAGVRSRLAAAASSTAASAGVAGSGRAAPGAYTGDRVDLRTRGDLSDEPVVTVPADAPPLWRSRAYDTWDGTSWTAPPHDRRLEGDPLVVAPPDGPTRTDRVDVRFRATGPVWSPGPVVVVRASGPRGVADAFGGVVAQTAPSYAVTSRVVAPTLAQLRAASGADPDDPRWTALPASVPERVRALGRQLAGGAPTRADAVLAVERELAARATYRLDSPVPGPGEDAVDRFLFVDRVGFCEQFAAAEVLLLRAAGIPARFVTGLAHGTVDGDRRTFRQKDLHAWVEVHFPGLGWVSSDPTPPATQLAGAPLRTRLAARVTRALQAADDVPGGRPALAAGLLGACVAVAAVLVLRRRRPVRARTAPPALDATGRPALQAFLRFDDRLGERRRRPAESLAELRARLDVPDDVRAALHVVEQECYGPAPPPADAAVAALERAR